MKVIGAFVGINGYQDPRINGLGFARADARAFAIIFQHYIPNNQRYLFTLLDSNATRANILDTIGNKMATLAQEEDLVIVHFSCHGSPEISHSVDDVSRYLVCHDTAYDNIFGTGIDLDRDLKRLLERNKAHSIFVFVDSCFSGMAGGRTFEGPRLQITKLKYRGVINLPALDLGEGRILMAAADDTQVALERRDLGHGLFTFSLMDSLTNPVCEDETISATTLYDQIYKKVYELSNGRQTPIFNGRSRNARLPRFIRRSTKEEI